MDHLHPLVDGSAAVVFDMDGVLADTEPLHEKALGAVLARRGIALGPGEYAGLVGMTHDSTWALLDGRYGLNEDVEALRAEYDALLMDSIAGGVAPAPGVTSLLAALADRSRPVGLASSSNRVQIVAALDAMGLAGSFSVVVAGDEVARGKPDPAIFLEAARRLGVVPRRCVAIEDSPHGMEAARAAGMAVVGIRNRYNEGRRLEADVLVDSLTELLTPEV